MTLMERRRALMSQRGDTMKTMSVITTRNIGEFVSGDSTRGMAELQNYMQSILPANATFAFLTKKTPTYVANNECVLAAFYGPLFFVEPTRCKFYRYQTSDHQPHLTTIPAGNQVSSWSCVLVAGEEYVCSYYEQAM